jgi:mycothiol synthase
MAGFDWAHRASVIVDGQGLRGVIVVGERDAADCRLARLELAARDAEAERRLLEWGSEVAAARVEAAVATIWRAHAHPGPLPELGFSVQRTFWRMDHISADEVRELPLPDGFKAVPRSESNLSEQAWIQVYNLAFADHWRHAPMRVEDWERRRLDEHPELSVMALTADGAPAAAVLCTLEVTGDARPQPVGIIGSVGTLPNFRRRGLARALTAEAVRRLRQAGARCISLYVDAGNRQHAYELYGQLGFVVAFQFDVWEKRI